MLFPQKRILAILIGSSLFSSLPGTVFGHGAMDFPKARQYECKSQGNHWTPATMKSAACRAALENSSAKQAAFDNWNGYTGFAMAPHSQQDARKAVPDGMLCTGNHPEYSGFNQPRSDWTTTTLQPDSSGKVGMKYYYTARHAPSFIEFYINKKNVDPTKKALGWDDVELLKRFEIEPGDASSTHTVNVSIPSDRTGKAIIFTRWQRYDAAGEGFYNCSDVNIKTRDGSEIPDENGTGDDDQVSGWVDKGAFITTADNPSVGEQVRFRLMGGTRGDNIVDVSLAISAANVANNKWIVELGQLLNREHSNLLQIGQQAADETITFNEQQPRLNHVFLSDQSYGYAVEIVKNAETPVIVLDSYTLEPIATLSTTSGYPVTGSSKSEVNWQWKRIAGDSRIVAAPANQAKTEIRIPGGVRGGTVATFELSGTSPKGSVGKAILKVNVLAAEVIATGPVSIAADKGGQYRARANFDNNKGEVTYLWSLLKNSTEVSGGIDNRGSIKTGLPAGDYLVKVVAESSDGERKATRTSALKITASDDSDKTGDYEGWKASKTYTAGNTVTWNGVNYIARNWTRSEPGKGGDWKLHHNRVAVEWQSTMVYVMGNVVNYQGQEYKASQWISQNNVPGVSVLWKLQ